MSIPSKLGRQEMPINSLVSQLSQESFEPGIGPEYYALPLRHTGSAQLNNKLNYAFIRSIHLGRLSQRV